MKREMLYEYEVLKDELLTTWPTMSESRIHYQLGQLNALAGWTGNLKDYIENILQPISKIIKKQKG